MESSAICEFISDGTFQPGVKNIPKLQSNDDAI